jgi:hypothetical protein
LIEYVINDEEAKAQELFHDIVVEKSREIYENLMNEEELDEESHDEKADDRAERDAEKVKKDLEYDYKHGRKVKEGEEEELDENEEELDEDFGGDASDDLIDDVEAEEQGMQEEEESDAEFDDAAEHDGEELTHDIEADHDEGDIENRVVDLEDKLDELMAEFESLMGGDEGGDEVVDIDGGDALEMDDTDTAEFSDEAMMENVTLDKVATPKMGDDGANNKSVVAFNSGAKGMQGSPVKMTGDTAQGRSAPKTGDLPEAGTFKNVPGKGGSNAKLAAAPKPVTAQASGVNTKSPVGKA